MVHAALRSRAIDPVALTVVAAYTALAGIAAARLVQEIVDGELLRGSIAALLLAVFSVRGTGWAQAVCSRVTIDAAGIRRHGRFGWYALLDEIAAYGVIRAYGRTYLVLLPRLAHQRRHSILMLGSRVPDGALAAPIDPALLPGIAELFASAKPPVRMAASVV